MFIGCVPAASGIQAPDPGTAVSFALGGQLPGDPASDTAPTCMPINPQLTPPVSHLPPSTPQPWRRSC